MLSRWLLIHPNLTFAQCVDRSSGPSHVQPGASRSSVVHADYICNGCGTAPIVGPRYTDTALVGFDLCHSCYTSDVGGVWPVSMVMLVLVLVLVLGFHKEFPSVLCLPQS